MVYGGRDVTGDGCRNMKTVKSTSRIAQEEEERVLQRALRQHRERKERQLQQSVQS